MNKGQIDYYQRTLNTLKSVLRTDVSKKNEPKDITPEDRCTLIRSGKAKLKKNLKFIRDYHSVVEVFEFPKNEKEYASYNKKYEAYSSKLNETSTCIMDSIVIEKDIKKIITIIKNGKEDLKKVKY